MEIPMKRMMKLVWTVGLAGILVSAATFAQQPATQQTGEAQQRTLEGAANKDFRYAVPSKVTEGVGRQAFLIKKKFFNISLRDSVNFTDNVFSLNSFKKSDFFHAVDFTVGASITLFRDWTISGRTTLRDFRYNRFPALDFNSASYAATLNYNIGKWNFYNTVEHIDLYQRSFGEHFFQEDDVTSGLYYSHPMGSRALVYIGGQYTRQFTHPDSSSKHLPTLYLGIISMPMQDLPKLRLTLSTSYSHADFIVGERTDDRFTVGSEISYEFFTWMTAAIGVNGAFGDSNQDAFDYTTFNSTGFVKFNYQF